MSPKMNQGLLIAGFALLGVVAVAGWTRTPARDVDPSTYAAQQLYVQPVAFDVNGRPIYGQSTHYSQPGVDPTTYSNNCLEPTGVQTNAPMSVQPIAYAPGEAPVYQTTRYRTTNRPRVVRTLEPDRDYVVRKNKRSTGKSVAIVAGSAGAGAAIGALAGGGKGAAIGGLSGGVAGFVYDRLTHNR